MQAHSASERSVWYLFLMSARVAKHYPTHPFRTVSEEEFSEVRTRLRYQAPCLRWKANPPGKRGKGKRRDRSATAPCETHPRRGGRARPLGAGVGACAVSPERPD